MATPPQTTRYSILSATTCHLPSLSTIVPRSFHPTNPYIRHLVPNTPLVQTWWKQIFTSKTNSPETSHLLTVVSEDTTDPPEEVFGILSMQLLAANEPGSGFWSNSSFPPTSDHDAAAYADVASNLASARQDLMGAGAHFVIELFGVDAAVKGSGLGKKLLLKACEIADEVGLPIFVMANASAKGIYQHPEIGFQLRDVKILPGEARYEEFMLVRPARGARCDLS